MSISSITYSIIDFLIRSRLTRSAQVLFFIVIPILFGSLTPQLALRVIVLFLISYHINFYNDYCDRFEDSIDAKKRARNLFCSPEDSKQFAIAVVFLNALWIIGLGLTLLFDQSFFLYACAGYLFGVVYSHPKIRVRNRTYWDMIWHGMWPVVGGTPVILSATAIPLSIRLASVGLTFLASVLAQMHQQLHDY
ncbi:UbiA family prenyltransferase, partial [candidate division WWE3 bacterium]|nr:UbiA family prenyltransferase [candidate division WWE3 bacterium]